jgi:hypothetical protein
MPNPGSREALDQGCKCPVYDNSHGQGIGKDESGEEMFWINADCPLHGSGMKSMMYCCDKCGFATLGSDELDKHIEEHK